MKIKLVNGESGALRRRLREVSAQLDPSSRTMDAFRTRLKKIRVADNTDMLTHRGGGTFAGEDRFGRDLAKPAESTIKGWKTFGGFVLAPHGLSSRMITRFFVKWERSGNGWRLTDGWKDIPWVIYHLRGCPKGSNPRRPNWSLPRRDVGGPSAKCWARWRAEFAKLSRSILKGK